MGEFLLGGAVQPAGEDAGRLVEAQLREQGDGGHRAASPAVPTRKDGAASAVAMSIWTKAS